MTPLAIIDFTLTTWIMVVVGFTGTALIGCVRLWRTVTARPAPAPWPAIWVLRPCEGDETGLRENLASSLLPYPGERRVLFLVPSETDPSFAAAHAAAEGHADAEVVVTRITSTRNRKSAHLAVGLARVEEAASRLPPGTPAPLVVQVDSDIRLMPGTITSLVTSIGDDPRVAASFAIPIETSTETFGDLCANGLLSASHQDFLVISAHAVGTGGIVPLAGPLAIHRLAPLVELGGFANLENILGEDFEVGRRLHAAGYEVTVAGEPAIGLDHGRSFRAILSRTYRWVMVVRGQRPGFLITYPLFLGATPIAAVLSAAMIAAGGWMCAPALALLVVLRAALAHTLRRIHKVPVSFAQALRLELAAELLMLCAVARAATTREVVWRGRRLRIGPGGTMEPL